jgi:hypothetical protein
MKKRKTAPVEVTGAPRRSASVTHAEARPSSQFKLTAKERALLKDPDWMTEDEADLILAMRSEAEGGKNIPFEEWFARHGL